MKPVLLDRRGYNRYAVKTQCLVAGRKSARNGSENETENISHDGILIRWTAGASEMAPREGEVVQVTIALPAHDVFGPRCMQLVARIVRLTRAADGSTLVAATLEKRTIRKHLNHRK